MKLSPPAALAACLLAAVGALAQDADPRFSVSGFGSLGAVYHNIEDAKYRRDVAQPQGAPAGQLSTNVDSMLGLQLSARPIPQFETTLQLISRNTIERDYQPQVSWAYAKYKPSDSVALRVGRLGLEVYMQGDSAEIGYANLLVRQPIVFYPRTIDGLDLDLLYPLGEGMGRLKAMAGSTIGKLTYSDPYDTQGSRINAGLAEYAQGSWVARASYGRITLNRELLGQPLDGLRAALAMAPNGAAVNRYLSMKNRLISYTSLAAAYDEGPLQGTASLVQIASEGWQNQRALTSQLGYRLGKFTPYLAYSMTRTDRTIIPTGIPSGLLPAYDALNQGVTRAQASFKNNQSDLALGARYDISRNTSLKLQVDRILYRDPGSIWDDSLSYTDYQNRPNRGGTLLSGVLEFVF
jgi:hypothetical protein